MSVTWGIHVLPLTQRPLAKAVVAWECGSSNWLFWWGHYLQTLSFFALSWVFGVCLNYDCFALGFPVSLSPVQRISILEIWQVKMMQLLILGWCEPYKQVVGVSIYSWSLFCHYSFKHANDMKSFYCFSFHYFFFFFFLRPGDIITWVILHIGAFQEWST